MTKIKFTWEDARAKFDQLYTQANERTYKSDILNVRLAIVIFNHTYGIFWLEDGVGVEGDVAEDVYLTIWTDVYARDFYEEKPYGRYELGPIVKSVTYLYNQVKHTIEDKVILDDLHKENKVKNQVSISYWDPHNWDRSSYVAPVINNIKGYLGVPGWEGSKVSQLAGAQGDVLGLLRKELHDAIDAGYIPNDLNATIRKYQGMAKPKYILTVTFKLKREDVLVDLDKPNKFKEPYQLLYERIIRVFNAFNYNKSNLSVGHIDRGYIDTVELNFLD